MGRFIDWLKLSVSPYGEMQNGRPLRTVPNPPTTQPTSPLTRAIDIVSAVDFTNANATRYVDRRSLMSIPAFNKAITFVCGIVGSLPYHAVNANGDRIEHKLLVQPERLRGYTRSVSMTHLAMDLYLDGASLWLVRERDTTTKFPTAVERIAFNEWTQDANTGDIIYRGEKQDPDNVRLFVGMFEGLCHVAGPTVYTIHKLRTLTARYLHSPQSREILQGLQGMNLPDEEIQELLTEWEDLARQGVTRYLPEAFKLEQVQQMTPEQLTLNASNNFEIEQVARLTGLDGFWLGVGQQSGLVYSNRVDLRQDLIDLYLTPRLLKPIEERLSLGDCTPNGQYVRANLDSFLRSNTLDRYNAHGIGLDKGFLTMDEVRALENRPPLPEETTDEDQ